MIKYICLPSGGLNILKFLGLIHGFINNNIIDLNNVEGYYGISAGSVLSSILCLGLEYETVVKYFIERTWHKIFNVNNIQLMNYFTDKGIFNKKHLIQIIEPLFKSKGYDLNTVTMKEFYNSTNKKLSIFALNACSFEMKEFNYETTPDILLIDAIYFSSCIPCIFKPYEYNGICYLDGGICLNSPLDICLSNENITKDEVFALECNEIHSVTRNIGVNDSYFPYILKIIDKLHVHGVSLVKNTDCKYFMRFNVIDYGNLDLNMLIHSEDMRKNIYLESIDEANQYIESIKDTKDD